MLVIYQQGKKRVEYFATATQHIYKLVYNEKASYSFPYEASI